jgi:hypothetical protein
MRQCAEGQHSGGVGFDRCSIRHHREKYKEPSSHEIDDAQSFEAHGKGRPACSTTNMRASHPSYAARLCSALTISA